MAMDMLRSCAIQRAEFGQERGTVAQLRWFLCKPGAKAFAGFHAFGSPVWEPQPYEWTQGPGIFEPLDNWSRNHIPCPDGQEFHGEADWFLNGIPTSVLKNPTPWERPECVGYAMTALIGSKSGSPSQISNWEMGSKSGMTYEGSLT